MLFRFRGRGFRRWAVSYLLAVVSTWTQAQNVVHIDATSPAIAPVAVPAQLGSNRNPNGDVIAVNSQYLTFDGKPWMPVMGEFHFSRYPAAQWEEEILKMKAAGVKIVSTYVIWIHHEQREGIFDWSGQRDLRMFTQLCAKHGMYVYPRIGPWAHAETRNGGIPDWAMKAGPVRENNPVYLREVGTFYAEIAVQLHGLLWKDGGPVIGLQIENEYRGKGPGKGVEHIRTLKKMATDDGLDVPLYTVTGWDGAAIPLDAALPVFGGYPDAPWDGSPKKLPPNEIYAFRFANRSAGSMGAIGGSGQSGAGVYRGTPFLTAEVGGGIEDTYFRRPVVTADDVAAVAPVMLGSGVNLLGYYMFHGGRNPDGGDITLQESQRTGYPTDVPVKSYDFQAPLGEFGQERPSLRKLKLVHYFLEDFGADLAPMQPHAPVVIPSSPTDLSVPRVSARTLGDKGFVFFNNHIRGAQVAAFHGFQVDLRLPGSEVHVPDQPIDLVPGAYGIWPVNLDLGGGAVLRYSTAQLLKRVHTGGHDVLFFFSIPGIAPELMLAPGTTIVHTSGDVQQQGVEAGLRVRPIGNGVAELILQNGTTLLVMPQARAETLWRGDDPAMLLATSADAFSDGDSWTLQANGDPHFTLSLLGEHGPVAGAQMAQPTPQAAADKFFASYAAAVPAVPLHVDVRHVSDAKPRAPFEMGPALSWRPVQVPFAPEDKNFAVAAVWNVRLPAIPKSAQLADVFLRVRYQGDAARLSTGSGSLLDDNFWNGLPWEIGLREVGQMSPTPERLDLHVLPLPRTYPMYLERVNELHFDKDTAIGLQGIDLIPRYQITVQIPAEH